MEKIFLSLLDMSMIGSYVALSVMIARFFLKKSPQIFSYLLWSVVFFRFLCPFTFESKLSLLPEQTQQMSQNFVLFPIEEFYVTQSTENVVDRERKTQIFMESTEIEPEETQNSGMNSEKISNTEFFMMIWFSGVLILTLYSVTSLCKMKRVLKSSIYFEENIYFTDKTDSPFVFGLWKPHIFIPCNATEEELAYIIAHEKYHISRFDHITRLICFMTVILHWFNPLVWCSYYLSERDMELSCDEAVLKRKSIKNRGEYARILLKFSGDRNLVTPLAFSKSNLKGRVKNIMKMKNTKLWVSGLSSVLVLGCAVGFAFEQPKNVVEMEQPVIEEDHSILEEMIQLWADVDMEEAWANAKEFGKDSINLTKRYVPITFVTENKSLFELLQTANSVEIQASGLNPDGQPPYSLSLVKEDSLFAEVTSILSKYDLSPINYFLYSDGGGDYFDNNEFNPSSEFLYSYEWDYLNDENNDEFRKSGYKFFYFFFELEDGSTLFLRLNENLNVVLCNYTRDNPDANAIFNYELPYCLKGDNVALFQEICNFLEDPNTPTVVKPEPKEMSVD